MTPLGIAADWLARRFSRRGLARAVVVLAGVLVVTLAALTWYFASVGLSLHELSPSNDDRVVVVDRAELASFERNYDPDREEGWCLYGATNDTHVRIDAVVHANPRTQEADHIQFTCVGETAGQALAGESAGLVGVAHSHPSKQRSYLSRADAMTWSRATPVVEVMGIYTDEGGVEFFTVSSLHAPLEKDVR